MTFGRNQYDRSTKIGHDADPNWNNPDHLICSALRRWVSSCRQLWQRIQAIDRIRYHAALFFLGLCHRRVRRAIFIDCVSNSKANRGALCVLSRHVEFADLAEHRRISIEGVIPLWSRPCSRACFWLGCLTLWSSRPCARINNTSRTRRGWQRRISSLVRFSL